MLPPRTHELSQKRWIAKFRVRVRTGPDAGKVVDSSDRELTVGSGPANRLRLEDPSVSRHHCVLEVTDFGIRLQDLGSTNGTYIGGCRVGVAYPIPGVEMRLGESVVVFESTSDEVCEELSADVQWGRLIGSSPGMRRIYAVLDKASPTNATILVVGETGTGKELVAESIHEASERAGGPFVVVDCAGLPAQLIESELFGHLRGAFSGAASNRTGLFEMASGGTLFLDEVQDLPLELQPKLLRALERQVVYPVGSSSPRQLDLRVVAATNTDLRRAVNRGTFRSDLWYRLNVLRVALPPLRDRREDIPHLVRHFEAELGIPPVEKNFVKALQLREWPGNVRELRNTVEAISIHGQQELDATTGSTPSTSEGLAFQEAKQQAMSAWERQYLLALMERCEWNLSAASRMARMDRGYLRSLLRRYSP